MKKMNDLIALQNKLFEAMEWIQDRSVKGANLTEEITRQLAFNELAKTAVANGALMGKLSNDLYDLDESIPLIPTGKSRNVTPEHKIKLLNSRTNREAV